MIDMARANIVPMVVPGKPSGHLSIKMNFAAKYSRSKRASARHPGSAEQYWRAGYTRKMNQSQGALREKIQA
jgi:hypothetical protein